MTLKEWMDKNGKKQTWLARILAKGKKPQDRHIQLAHRLYHGAIPKLKIMFMIYDLTNGLVNANSIFGLPDHEQI